MKLHRQIAGLSLLFLGLIPIGTMANEPSLNVMVNRDQIYIGESVILVAKVSGVDQEIPPDLSAIPNTRVEYLGSQSDSQLSITIINGRLQRTGFQGRSFTYRLTPASPGTFKVGPITLRLAGRVLTVEGPTIQVAGIEQQDRVLISVRASKETVLVDEPFDITLTVNILQLKGQYAGVPPIDPGDPPRLKADFLNLDPIAGLTSTDLRALLQKMLIQRGNDAGFIINEHKVQRDPMESLFAFDMLGQPTLARFSLPRRTVQINGQSYTEFSVRLTYTPREEHSYTFGPVEFKGKAVMGIDAAGRMVGRSIFAVGPACTVRVLPPPEEGRPTSYIGILGSNLVAEAVLDTQTCNVGDPLILTLTVSGQVNVDKARAPLLQLQDALTRDFRFYDDTVQSVTRDRKRIFTYTIRPVRAGTIELPPIEVSYFDTHLRKYQTVTTKPLPIRVNATTEIRVDDVLSGTTNRITIEGDTLQSTDLPLAPFTLQASHLNQSLLGSRTQKLVAGAGPAMYLLCLAVLVVRHWRQNRQGTRRQRHALGAALRLLTPREGSKTPRACACISQAFRQYLGDRFGLPPDGITPLDARVLLARHGLPTDLTERWIQQFQTSFDASYSDTLAPPDTATQSLREAEESLRQIEEALTERARANTGEEEEEETP